MKHLFKKPAACATKKTTDVERDTVTITQSSRWGRKVALLVLLIISICWCWQKVHNPATFPIRAVKIVDSNNHVDHQLLQQTIFPFLANGMLWLEATDLQKTLEQIPWVAQVNLKRGWPDELIITIIEQKPIAHWNNNALLNKAGDVFNPGNVTANDNLPWLNGPENQQKVVWLVYQQMNQLLLPINVQISQVWLSPRQAWQIQLNNGILLLLGKDQVLARLQRFISAYPLLFANRADQLDYVDLRYSNGFAAKWKNNPPTASATPQK